MTEADQNEADLPPYRYTAALAGEIEARWQDHWDAHGTFHAPNPDGPLRDPDHPRAGAPKLYAMDMFPYPSGEGLHVGHPLGYIGTDCYTRYARMVGFNVLHPMGFDAFGLPAEQYAVETGTHPRKTTEENVARYRAQLRRLGLAYDQRRSVATTDLRYYRWTQWIFRQVFSSWFDPVAGQARPITELVAELEHGSRPTPDRRAWSELSEAERRSIVDDHRLAYLTEAPVNWCPGLGTVLANEEITADGRSERGNFPVFTRHLTQWMLRITAYADRLLDDLDTLDWPEPIKLMQRNWIGRSTGAYIDFGVAREPKQDRGGVAREPEQDRGGVAREPEQDRGGVAREPEQDRGGTPAGPLRVFTTRPDTVFGATYMVLAPEHPLVDTLLGDGDGDGDGAGDGAAAGAGDGRPGRPDRWPEGTKDAWTGGHPSPREAVAAYRKATVGRTEAERQAESRDKTGVFAGAYATNPANGARIPVFVADYVLAGYGTGAIMAVPGQDERDWEFAERFDLPIIRTVAPPVGFSGKAYLGDGPAINSTFPQGLHLDGLRVADAKARTIEWLAANGHGQGAVTYRLRDWLFSRQRYWGEPFPIVYDQIGPVALPDSALPVELPEVADFSPKTFDPQDADSTPETPLSRNSDWMRVELDLGDGPKVYTRETNVMPQWAGSCWYELRYLDPTNDAALVDPANERYWMGPQRDGDSGGVDLYVGGVEHAVLHLLYARFWHKVLYDLGHVSSFEPFRKLYNQGYIQAYAYTDPRGFYVPAHEVVERDGRYFHGEVEVRREYGKMGKSLKNVVTPDFMCRQYGADTFRVYEMSMGPLDVSRPWETRAVVGSYRFLQRVWRLVVDEQTGATRVTDAGLDHQTHRLLHRVVDAVRGDLEALRFNTAVAKLIELTNRATAISGEHGTPRAVVEPLVLMVSPFAPHLAEELWRRLGHPESLAYAAFPEADPAALVAESVTYPVQVAGKVRARVEVAADAAEEQVREAALAAVADHLGGRDPRKVIVVPGRMVSVVP